VNVTPVQKSGSKLVNTRTYTGCEKGKPQTRAQRLQLQSRQPAKALDYMSAAIVRFVKVQPAQRGQIAERCEVIHLECDADFFNRGEKTQRREAPNGTIVMP